MVNGIESHLVHCLRDEMGKGKSGWLKNSKDQSFDLMIKHVQTRKFRVGGLQESESNAHLGTVWRGSRMVQRLLRKCGLCMYLAMKGWLAGKTGVPGIERLRN